MGPRLFLVYINDIDNDDIISKFANDRKLCGKNGGETDTKFYKMILKDYLNGQRTGNYFST